MQFVENMAGGRWALPGSAAGGTVLPGLGMRVDDIGRPQRAGGLELRRRVGPSIGVAIELEEVFCSRASGWGRTGEIAVGFGGQVAGFEILIGKDCPHGVSRGGPNPKLRPPL